MPRWSLIVALLFGHGVKASHLRLKEDASVMDHDEAIRDKPLRPERRRLLGELSSGTALERYWQAHAAFESFKDSSVWTTEDRQTFTKMHYIVLPLWYSDEADTVGSRITPNTADYTAMAQQYNDMSWGKLGVTFEYLDQFRLTGVPRNNPSLGEVEDATRAYVTDTLGLEEYVDYDGIIIIHNNAFNGNLKGTSAWGTVNGNFIWALKGSSMNLLRHEAGHNFGHHHHYANIYSYRQGVSTTEGYDMMSSGNDATIADLNAASKWWYNWIPDDAVVLLTPGGASSDCPTCLDEVSSLKLYAFDSRTVTPNAERPVAVHIPIAGDGTSTPYVYGYWLSYRTGYTDSAKGLSIHLVWLDSGWFDFGMDQESLLFDANGDTSTRSDAFVVPGTCYVVTPPSELYDFDPIAAEAVQPIVCVDDLTQGVDITISVSFLDPESPPSNTISLASTHELGCASGDGEDTGQVGLSNTNGNVHLLHYSDMGVGGIVEFRLNAASDGSTTKAYFYDSYPYAYLALGSPIGYGAFQTVSSTSSATPLDYEGLYNDVYVLIVMDESASPDTTVSFRSTCTIMECRAGEFLSTSGRCESCPSGRVSEVGAVGLDECVFCGNGFHPIGLGSNKCYFSYETTHVEDSPQWRIWTMPQWTSQGWFLEIDNIRFFTSQDCSAGTEIPVTSNMMFASHEYSDDWSVDRALPGTYWHWGGWHDDSGYIYIGVKFSERLSLGCIQFDQNWGHYAKAAAVQAKSGGDFVNVAFFDNLSKGTGLQFSFGTPPSAMPSSSPSASLVPSSAPSVEPSLSPSVSMEPTGAPSSAPSSPPSVSMMPSATPTATPTKPPVTLTNKDYNLLAKACSNTVKKDCSCAQFVNQGKAACFSKAIGNKCKPTWPDAALPKKTTSKTLKILNKFCVARLAK